MDAKTLDLAKLAGLVLKYGKPRHGEELKVLRLLERCGRSDYMPTAEECAAHDSPVSFMIALMEEYAQ